MFKNITKILSRVWVTKDGILIGNWIYWILTGRNNKYVIITLLLTFTLQNTTRYSLQSISNSFHGFITQELKVTLKHTLPISLHYSTHSLQSTR
jgi:hypothetical protein